MFFSVMYIEALRTSGSVFHYASEELKGDKDFVLEANVIWYDVMSYDIM